MKLFFAWIESNEVFLPGIHCREDLRIFKCVIAQRETETAVARLLTDSNVLNEDSQTKKTRYGVISFHDGEAAHVLMRGKLVHIPRHAADGFLEWELNAEAIDATTQINQLVAQLKEDPTFEAGFYDKVSLAEVLESRTEVMCWDPRTSRLSLSDIMSGSKHTYISDEILTDSLVVRIGKTSVNAVHVTIEANWQQRHSDVINVAPLIARKFNRGVINTLTVDALVQSWPREGDKIGLAKTRKNTGYTVVKSWLKQLPKGLNGLPATTTPLYMSENGKSPRLMTFNHGWFKACLWVNWNYKQSCREVVDFSVLNVASVAGGQVRHLHFRLANGDAYAEVPSAPTVLRSDRGHKLLDYAERVARAHIVGASRQLEVEFCVPFQRLWHVDLDTTLDVTHKDLPGGRVVGKVVSYQLRATSDSWVVWVKIASCVDGMGAEVAGQVPVVAEFMNDYVAGDYAMESSSNWPLVKVSGDVPRDPSLFRVSDLVESIVVKGDGADQFDVLQVAQYPAVMHYKDALHDEAFSLEVKFMDLAPKALCETRWERAVPIVV
jgi:hypothetical protein